MIMPLIELKAIKKSYTNGPFTFEALKGIDLVINKGEFVAIMGPSGSGKSTLMHIIGCLDTPTTGSYFLASKNVAKMSDHELAHVRNEDIGFVFQAFNLLPRLTVKQNVELPFSYYKGDVSITDKDKRVEDALKKVGLFDKRNNRSNELSGGQIQRTAIARSLILDPAIILADEPTGNLDSKTGLEILEVLTVLNKQGNTIILVTHEDEIAAFSKRVIKLKDGLIISDKTK